jgi:hypothetical protein
MQTTTSDLSVAPPRAWVGAAFVTGLLVGTLDIAAASIHYVLVAHKSPANVLNFIASGIFGPTAFSGGAGMALAGLALHYFIATMFALAFYWLAGRWPTLPRHKVLAGLLYGVLIWLLMNLLVLPLSQTPELPFKLVSAAIGAGILMLCVGLPIALRAARYYARNQPPAG